jgi:hypothetical protein
MSGREVTEADFRKPEFRDAKAEDYEFDGTGEVVRKDRWESTVRQIVGVLEDGGHRGVSRRNFELGTVVVRVRQLVANEVLTRCQSDGDGDCMHGKCPQSRDGEPAATGRHCPLDNRSDGE